MKTLFTIFTVLFLFITQSFAQHLYVLDPQQWGWYNGTIEETKITYEPRGIYMNVDWEITFSARGVEDFGEKDTIEVDYRFYLPENSIVYDSKLWFEDSILTGMIIDRWSANQVYESIVNRRKDPSILFKNGPDAYQLKIFPMAAKESRKVRLSFLIPTTWTTKTVASEFLSRNLLASANPIGSINFYANVKSPWKNPSISGLNEIEITRLNNPDAKATHYANIHFKHLQQSQFIKFDTPLNKGIHLSFFENGVEKFYQMALSPTAGTNLSNQKKLLFIIDYEKGNSKFSQTEMLALLKNNLIELLNEKDSFNILYPGQEIMLASEDWISGSEKSIIELFEKLGNEPIKSFDNLANLLKDGINFANEIPETKLILMANSDKLSDPAEANDLIDELMELMKETIPVYIADFQNEKFFVNRVAGKYYRGNEYFYTNLAKLTGGDYVFSFNGETFDSLVKKIFSLATEKPNVVDIHTKLENGFCYGRYNLGKSNYNLLSGVYLETGRYNGEFPFEVNVSGIYGDEVFSNSISIVKSQAVELDTLAVKAWYGNEIFEMESSGHSFSLINDIIEKSIANRVLCYYTAFLCLEPSMMHELEEVKGQDPNVNRGWGPEDGGVLVSSPEITKSELKLNAYPNPFTDNINIELQLNESISAENIQLEIYDLFGKKIKSFDLDKFTGGSSIQLIWNARDESNREIPSGTYLLICTSPEGRISKKLVLL